MKFTSTQIRGKSRGKQMGVPTINLAIPKGFSGEDGVYAARVTIDSIEYQGALHIGPRPAFNEPERTIEVYILNVDSQKFPETAHKPITVEMVKKIRDIQMFDSTAALVERIMQDVSEIRSILN